MDIFQLPGLGPKRIEALRKAGLNSIADLLYNIPRNYVDCRPGEKAVIIGTISRSGVVRGRRSRFVATLSDGTGSIQLLFFQGTSYWAKRIKNDTRRSATTAGSR